MKSRRAGNDSCFCSSCLYKNHKAYRGIARTGSKIDKLYRDKYLPLRESKLIDKLERTRAVYNDIRAPLADSERNKYIENNNRRSSTELSKCCSCCKCTKSINNTGGDTGVSSDFDYVRHSSQRKVRFKPEFIKSEPCVCLAKLSNLLKKHSASVQSKLKREFSVPVLTNKIKEASLKQRPRVGKVIKLTEKVKGSKANYRDMLKLSVKNIPKSRVKVQDMKHKIKNEGLNYLQELNPRMCPCPQEKLVLKIRKDSIRKFYEDLEKKRTLKHLECKSECIQDICIPKECLDKIKLGKRKKSQKKQKTSQKQRLSFKQIVSKVSGRKLKKSVMCQCMPITEYNKDPSNVRKNTVKFISSKNDSRNEKYFKSNITQYKPKRNSDGGKTLKRCFCTLKFKPSDSQNTSQKYSPRSKPNHYPHSGQNGDMIISSTQMNKNVKSKSNCTIYDCNPNECLKDYNYRQKPPSPSYESGKDNERVLRIGSSISFNIEFFKENIPKNTSKSIKTYTVPHYLSNKSVKSIRPQKSNKIFTTNKKKKAIIMNKLKNDEILNINNNLSSKILRKINKNASSKSKIKTDAKDMLFQNTSNKTELNTEMVDQSTKITNKDMRLLNSNYLCKPQVCVPDNCDPQLCLEKLNRHKHAITTTDFPKMVSVASGIHKKKLKHTYAQSKSLFGRKKCLDKFDLNPFEHIEQKSNDLSNMSNRNTLRLSSNFSFAIEIGKGVPHMSPIGTTERYNSVSKAKKIKYPLSHDNYTLRKSNSKISVINTMVKRCMCTLNLTKNKNKDKSRSNLKDNLTPKVYTVNTMMTSNVGSFLTNRMYQKKKSREVQTFARNGYKSNNISSYAGWHSQIVCNYMHVFQRKKYISERYLKKLKIKRHFKNNLYPVSKSLSYLSDTKFKKYSSFTPWYCVESKNITIFESSDYISNLYHDNKHETFTKSSKYWEKSYCTMNLKTIYGRNGKQEKYIDNYSRKNCVRVGSNLKFNIEFYKNNNSSLKPKYDMLPTTIAKRDDSFKTKITQDVVPRSDKAAHFVPENQRCFCTLKLQNKSHTNHIDNLEQTPPVKVSLKTNNLVSKSQNTTKIKRFKNIPDEIKNAESVINTISLVPQKQFFPPECIPGMCVSGECAPASCYKILYKSKLNKRSISVATKTTKKMRAGVLTQSSVKNATTQSQNLQSHKEHTEQRDKRTISSKERTHNLMVPYGNVNLEKECTKFGSNISFNIEFYKRKYPSTTKHIQNAPDIGNKIYSKTSKYTDTSLSTKMQNLRHKKFGVSPFNSVIKRCFCALKLQKKQKTSLLTKVHSVGTMAGVRNKWYSDKNSSNQLKVNEGNAYIIYNNKSNIGKHMHRTLGGKDTVSKYEKQHIAMSALLPNECEPGTCVPGVCSPLECLQKIKARKLVKREIGSVTSRPTKKSLGISSKYRATSIHRRIQTVPFKENDVKVSTPKAAKQKYDESLSNNQCVRIGSNINFSIELFKGKNCDKNDVSKTSSPSYKHILMNSKAGVSDATKKRKNTKYTITKSQGPIVNYQVNSKKQGVSQLSQTRQKYFSKYKSLLPYECKPNVCIPGQCDPFKCYEMIQNRHYKNCSAVTVANVRNFATNATPCYTCKSKRIQTGQHYREGAGIKFMKPISDNNCRKSIRISSNFGFHIEICKKRQECPLREMQFRDDGYKYSKKVLSRLHNQASQSQYIKRRSQSTIARSKLQRCFCTKKFFNSAKNASRNVEFTTNYCSLIPNNVPKINNINNNNGSYDRQYLLYQPINLNSQKKKYAPTKNFKNNIKPKRFLKFRRNTCKALDNNKMGSYLSFDLDLYKSKMINRRELSDNQKVIRSNEHIFIPKQKRLKTAESKNIQGQGDSEKTVHLKRCYSTFDFKINSKEKHNTEMDLKYKINQVALEREEYNIKQIYNGSSGANIFLLPEANKRWHKDNERSLFNSNNKRKSKHVYKNIIIKIKTNNNFREKEEKCGYFRNVCNTFNPYIEKMNLNHFFKNIMSHRLSDKNVKKTEKPR